MAKPFPIEIEQQVAEEQDYKCCNCGIRLSLFDRPDHIIPQTKTNIKVYGENLIYSKENCQIPCLHCHQNKSLWSKLKQKKLLKEWELFNKSKLKL